MSSRIPNGDAGDAGGPPGTPKGKAAAAPSGAEAKAGGALQNYHVERLDRGRGKLDRAARKQLEAQRAERGQDDTNLIRKLWPFLRPERGWLTIAIVSSLITSGISLVRPLIMLWAIDRSVATKDAGLILTGGLAFAAAAIVEQLLSFVQTYATQVVGARAMADL